MKDLLPLATAAGITPHRLALEPGEPAPLFDGAPLKGRASIRLTDYRSKVVYLDFWASWCAACRQSLPWLERLHRDHAAAGLEVIAVNVDPKRADALQFLKLYPVGFPLVTDVKGTIAARYNVQDLPTGFLLDRAGVVRNVYAGFARADIKVRRQAIAGLLREPA